MEAARTGRWREIIERSAKTIGVEVLSKHSIVEQNTCLDGRFRRMAAMCFAA
jgi:hypothetical protein